MERGKVYLVGAGPGDAGLITKRALFLLQRADVVIYDRLASTQFLLETKEGCELIHVGKEPNKHSFKQEEIQKILLEKARQGKAVLRLKGGDPFIFGRGGEEAQILWRNKIPFEVVPGISSFYCACAYEGIPVTHREYASSFHVYTGHKAHGTSLDYETIAKEEGTLIFLMSIKNIVSITKGLLDSGKSKDTPAAAIEWGTTPKQRAVYATLETISDTVIKNNISNPSILILGDVIKAREEIQWQKNRPLWKRNILINLSSNKKGEALRNDLEEQGAQVTELVVTKIAPAKDCRAMDQAIQSLELYSWIFFTSANGVSYFFSRLFALKKDIRLLQGIKLFVIGDKTRAALEERGLFADAMPDTFSSLGAAPLLQRILHAGDRVLLPTSQIGGEKITQEIEAVGASVDVVCAYSTTPMDTLPDEIADTLFQGGYDAITFASASQADAFVHLTDKKPFASKCISIGPMTTNALERHGLCAAIQAENATFDALAKAVAKILEKKTEDLV